MICCLSISLSYCPIFPFEKKKNIRTIWQYTVKKWRTISFGVLTKKLLVPQCRWDNLFDHPLTTPSIYIYLTYLNRFHRGEEMLRAYILSTWQAANKSWNTSLLKTSLMRDFQQSRCLAMEVRWLEFLFLNIEAIKFVLQGVKQLTEICAKTTS